MFFLIVYLPIIWERNDTDLSVKLCLSKLLSSKNQVLGGISQDFLVHLVGAGCVSHSSAATTYILGCAVQKIVPKRNYFFVFLLIFDWCLLKLLF